MMTDDQNDLIAGLNTEQRNTQSVGISKLPVQDMLIMMNQEDQTVAQRVKDAIPQIELAVNLIERCLRNGGRMVYVGAGTSGRLGIMDAAECGPTFGVYLVHCVMAGGKEAVFFPKEVLEDQENNAEKDLYEFGLKQEDVIIAAAASGRTPYCIGALKYAQEIGAGRVSISCNPNALLSRYAEVGIEINTGAEIVMGSTRLKAGTAQKMVMNMLSTTVMIRLGRTYDNLMVYIHAHNQKADNRAKRLFMEATNISDSDVAEKMLIEAKGDLALAVFCSLSKLPADRANDVLTSENGDIDRALGRIK